MTPRYTPEMALAVIDRFVSLYHYSPDITDLASRIGCGRKCAARLVQCLQAAGLVRRAGRRILRVTSPASPPVVPSA